MKTKIKIKQEADKFAGVNYDCETEEDAFYHTVQKEAFVAGYEQGYKNAVDKVCKLIFEYNKRQARKFGAKSMMRLPDYTINVGDFRKVMEEQQ